MGEDEAMNQEKEQRSTADRPESRPYRVRLPGFITDDEVGLGDVIKHATSLVGIRPCDDCARRAAILNRRMVFSGRRSATRN
jgi:hypothetical protein